MIHGMWLKTLVVHSEGLGPLGIFIEQEHDLSIVVHKNIVLTSKEMGLGCQTNGNSDVANA